MAAPVTLAELVERVRERADMQSADAETFDWDDTDDPRWAETQKVVRFLNRELKQLWGKLQLALGEDRYLVDHTISLVADQTDYALPERFQSLAAIYATDGSNLRVQIGPYDPQDEWELRQLSVNTTRGIYFYRYGFVLKEVGGAYEDRLRILPTPGDSTHTLELRFVPAFRELRHSGDRFDGVNGWEDWAVLGAAASLLAAEGDLEESSAARAEQMALGLQIDQLAAQRDATPPQVQVERHDGGYDYLDRRRDRGYYT